MTDPSPFERLPVELLEMILVQTMPSGGFIELRMDWSDDDHILRNDKAEEEEPRLWMTETGLGVPATSAQHACSAERRSHSDEDIERRVGANGDLQSLVRLDPQPCSLFANPHGHTHKTLMKHLVALAHVNQDTRYLVTGLLRCSRLPPALSALGAPEGLGQPVFRQMMGQHDACGLRTKLRGRETTWGMDWTPLKASTHVYQTPWVWLMLGDEFRHVTDFGLLRCDEADPYGQLAPQYFLFNSMPSLQRLYIVRTRRDASYHTRRTRRHGRQRASQKVLVYDRRGACLEERGSTRVSGTAQTTQGNLQERVQNYSKGCWARRGEVPQRVEFEEMVVEVDTFLLASRDVATGDI